MAQQYYSQLLEVLSCVVSLIIDATPELRCDLNHFFAIERKKLISAEEMSCQPLSSLPPSDSLLYEIALGTLQ